MGGNKQSQSESKKKSPQDAPPNPNSIPNREAFQRMNFLFQASTYLNSVDASHHGGSQGESSNGGNDRKAGRMTVGEASSRANGERCKNRKSAMLSDLSAGYIQDLRTIGNKNVLRIDPSVKRKLCKACNTVLIPGTTASVRIKSGRNKLVKKVIYTCLHCNACRSIPATPLIPSGEDTMDYVTVDAGSIATDATLQASDPGDINGEATQKKPKQRRRSVKYKSSLLSERRDAGHVVVIGNEAVSFE
ncbi:hypothetical protein Clacol_000441 [Clathrus columnatus]|uniref:Uncharacterized protein n=1 Tax=Clathrus columnatus TaxID=1419009 RepID=A0AAV5A2Z5_9AGAM|nr:hypothetical protein Clacol_000441 [Clathrus columnatus]